MSDKQGGLASGWRRGTHHKDVATGPSLHEATEATRLLLLLLAWLSRLRGCGVWVCGGRQCVGCCGGWQADTHVRVSVAASPELAVTQQASRRPRLGRGERLRPGDVGCAQEQASKRATDSPGFASFRDGAGLLSLPSAAAVPASPAGDGIGLCGRKPLLWRRPRLRKTNQSVRQALSPRCVTGSRLLGVRAGAVPLGKPQREASTRCVGGCVTPRGATVASPKLPTWGRATGWLDCCPRAGYRAAAATPGCAGSPAVWDPRGAGGNGVTAWTGNRTGYRYQLCSASPGPPGPGRQRPRPAAGLPWRVFGGGWRGLERTAIAN